MNHKTAFSLLSLFLICQNMEALRPIRVSNPSVARNALYKKNGFLVSPIVPQRSICFNAHGVKQEKRAQKYIDQFFTYLNSNPPANEAVAKYMVLRDKAIELQDKDFFETLVNVFDRYHKQKLSQVKKMIKELQFPELDESFCKLYTWKEYIESQEYIPKARLQNSTSKKKDVVDILSKAYKYELIDKEGFEKILVVLSEMYDAPKGCFAYYNNIALQEQAEIEKKNFFSSELAPHKSHIYFRWALNEFKKEKKINNLFRP